MVDAHDMDSMHILDSMKRSPTTSTKRKSISTIRCSLAVATYGEKVHMDINLVVHQRFSVANSPNSAIENFGGHPN